MTQMVLISGKQGAGKTTLATELFKAVQRRPRHYAWHSCFAEPIYQIHDFARGVMKEAGMAPPEHLKNKDGFLLQFLGTEWGRKTYGDGVWIKHLQGRMKKHLENHKNTVRDNMVFIVSDCRFENEFDAFWDALRVRLVAPEEIRKPRCSQWRDTTTHQSEIDLDTYESNGKFDLTLNTSTMTASNCCDLITAQLTKNHWIKRRYAKDEK